MKDIQFTVIKEDGGKPIKAWIHGVELESSARQQLVNIAQMPFIRGHVAVMPDVHTGVGATIGSVIPTKGAIIPAAVGVDIGCGMMAVQTSLTANDLPDSLGHIRSAIEQAVPHGRTDNGGANDAGAWQKDIPKSVLEAYAKLQPWYSRIVDKHPKIEHHAASRQLCSLGGGNHFIEICLDTDNNVWIMLHSGSRGPGNKIGSYFIELAKKDMERWFINLPDKDLAYLPEGSDFYKEYLIGIEWAQEYARINRELMMSQVIGAMRSTIPVPFSTDLQIINCHHNYVNKERHFGEDILVTRKGAVSAKLGELGIIPGSMGAKSFIVVGKGNKDSFHSCSHGAGRRMSRTEAKKKFTVEDQIKATEGVECRKDSEVIDEIPMAYKNIDDVMKAQSDLVDIKYTLKQILCVKG